jgi:hypothetical protein
MLASPKQMGSFILGTSAAPLKMQLVVSPTARSVTLSSGEAELVISPRHSGLRRIRHSGLLLDDAPPRTPHSDVSSALRSPAGANGAEVLLHRSGKPRFGTPSPSRAHSGVVSELGSPAGGLLAETPHVSGRPWFGNTTSAREPCEVPCEREDAAHGHGSESYVSPGKYQYDREDTNWSCAGSSEAECPAVRGTPQVFPSPSVMWSPMGPVRPSHHPTWEAESFRLGDSVVLQIPGARESDRAAVEPEQAHGSSRPKPSSIWSFKQDVSACCASNPSDLRQTRIGREEDRQSELDDGLSLLI